MIASTEKFRGGPDGAAVKVGGRSTVDRETQFQLELAST